MDAHAWDISPKEAVELQKVLRRQICLTSLTKPVTLIGGCDVSMNRFAKEGFAGFVVLEYPSLRMVSHSVVKDKIPFPYIPGLLSFREIPMLLKAWEKLEPKPDLLLVDGNPLQDIGATERISLVVFKGERLNRPDLFDQK